MRLAVMLIRGEKQSGQTIDLLCAVDQFRAVI
jgi:hypothetical protein